MKCSEPPLRNHPHLCHSPPPTPLSPPSIPKLKKAKEKIISVMVVVILNWHSLRLIPLSFASFFLSSYFLFFFKQKGRIRWRNLRPFAVFRGIVCLPPRGPKSYNQYREKTRTLSQGSFITRMSFRAKMHTASLFVWYLGLNYILTNIRKTIL